ncbi:hypothetical protein HWV62_31813 [Athelia sp. TMB]|nr:hypothetical protein HWV62_31813 [Athelia sp. TMB]
MPEGCGTWPAIWEVDEANWPNAGEIDIVEGVNNVTPNQSTLHTGPGCSIPASGVAQYGTTVGTDCNANDNGNAGCGVKSPDTNSYGPTFNADGGGYYAMERTTTSIKRSQMVPPASTPPPGDSLPHISRTPTATFRAASDPST